MKSIRLAAFLAGVLLLELAHGADPAQQFSSYRQACANYAGNVRMSAMLGCVNLSADPQGTREDIAAVVQDSCQHISRECRIANEARRRELEGLARSLYCAQASQDCGGTGLAETPSFDLCQGQIKLSRFLLAPNSSRFMATLQMRDGGAINMGESTAMLDNAQPAGMEGRQWMSVVSRSGGEAATGQQYQDKLRNYINDNCDFFLRPSREEASLVDTLGARLRAWISTEMSCQPNDSACQKKAAELRKKVRVPTAAFGVRG